MNVMTRENLCETVHRDLEQLLLRKGRPKDIVRNGIYFWYEEDEVRRGEGQRVTRVGINTKQNRPLLKRVKGHFDRDRKYSIFRRHLGGALMNRNGESESEIKEWYKKKGPRFNDQKFREYEKAVTKEVENGYYRILKVDDKDLRKKLEEKLIALFANCNHYQPSNEWLGNHASKPEIRKSGLWNVQHTNSINRFTEDDLPQLRQFINQI